MLSSLIVLPVFGAFTLAFINPFSEQLTRVFALGLSLFILWWAILLLVLFDNSFVGFQFIEVLDWNSFFGIRFQLGVDGLSIHLILLTAFIVPFCILTTWSSVNYSVKDFFVLFFLLESGLFAVFSLLDLFLFYIAFESTLLPMFFIVGFWGSRSRRINAAYFLFLYTLLGSVFMLLAILYIWVSCGTTDFTTLSTLKFTETEQIFLWFAFFLSFAVKVPLFPFHIWLPEAHVEAPTVGSVILAGILLKLGGYGFLRFSIILFPEATAFFMPFVVTLSILGIIYASLTTLQQVDLKKVIAYSSVAHMSFVMLGIFSSNVFGIQGGVILMITHGIVSSALFLCVGVLYDRYGTRIIKHFSGLVQLMPMFSLSFTVFSLANLGLPLTASFIGEILVLIGTFQISVFTAILSTTSVIFSASYSLWALNRICFGSVKSLALLSNLDLSRREFFIITPFVFLVFFLGVFPNILSKSLHCVSIYIS